MTCRVLIVSPLILLVFLLAFISSACSISSIEISTSTSKIIPRFGLFEMVLVSEYGFVQLTWCPAMNWVSINISVSCLLWQVMRRLLFDCLINGLRWRISWRSLKTPTQLTLVMSTCVPFIKTYRLPSDAVSWFSNVSIVSFSVSCLISWELDCFLSLSSLSVFCTLSTWTSSCFGLLSISGHNFCQVRINAFPKLAASLSLQIVRNWFADLPMRVSIRSFTVPNFAPKFIFNFRFKA